MAYLQAEYLERYYKSGSEREGFWFGTGERPFGVGHGSEHELVLLLGDGAADFLFDFRPPLAWHDWSRQPAHPQGVVLKCLEKQHRGIGADADGMKKIVRRGFNESLVAEIQHRLGADDPLVPHPRRGFATFAEHIHHIRPSAGDEFGITCREKSLGHDQIQVGVGD